MRTRNRLLIAAFTATAVLGVAIGSAAANRFEIVNGGKRHKIAWSALTVEAGGSRIVCPVTLEGSFGGPTFHKARGIRVATIDRAAKGVCTEGSATLLTETLPWELQYSSYGGTLPNIEGIAWLELGMAFRVSNGISCLATTEVNEPGRGISRVGAGGAINELQADTSALIGVGGGFFCEFGTKAHFAGTATFKTAEGAAWTLRLI